MACAGFARTLWREDARNSAMRFRLSGFRRGGC